MTDTSPPATRVDLQDPLPESNWFWRRVFCFFVTGVLLFFMWGLVDRVGKVAVVEPRAGIPALVVICKWTMAFACTVVTYYLLAPSAEQITKVIKTASLLKAGVQIASRAIERPGRHERTQTVGLPPAPPLPSPAPEAPQPPIVAPEAPTEPTAPIPDDISEADIDAVRPPVGSYFTKEEAR
jgi:hypothetical protein